MAGSISGVPGVTNRGRSIAVRDTGHGIPPDALGRVFDPLFTTKELGEGSGLGLAICREIARAHGGDVTIESEPGEGTTVTLSLVQP